MECGVSIKTPTECSFGAKLKVGIDLDWDRDWENKILERCPLGEWGGGGGIE